MCHGREWTHTYAEEGIYNASVLYTCPKFGDSSHTASFQATVQDAPLTGSGIAITGTAGQRLSAIVAHIDDANPLAGAGDFSIQISWGDGSATAGLVASAAGGGFDVTDAHTYAAAGSYALHTTITDIGGSVTSVHSIAQVTAHATPLPPPGLPAPPPTLGPPVAQFTYAPKRPCSGDRVAFDASKSTGQGLRIIHYRWPRSGTFLGVPLPTEVFTAPMGYSQYGLGDFNQTEIIGQRAADYVVVDYNAIGVAPQPRRFPAWHVEIISRPVNVTLQVVARDGETASITHRVTFRNPKENVVIAYENGIAGGPACGPSVTEPIGIVNRGKGCDSRTLLQKIELSTLKLRPAVLPGQPSGVLHLSRASATVTVATPCRYALLGCDGTLEAAVGQSQRPAQGEPESCGPRAWPRPVLRSCRAPQRPRGDQAQFLWQRGGPCPPTRTSKAPSAVRGIQRPPLHFDPSHHHRRRAFSQGLMRTLTGPVQRQWCLPAGMGYVLMMPADVMMTRVWPARACGDHGAAGASR